MMEVRLCKFHRKPEDAHIQCIKELIAEHNPYVVLDIDSMDEGAINSWIRAKSLNSEWHQEDELGAIFYWIYCGGDVVGVASIRQHLRVELYVDSGHVGLCIRASFRHNGYGYAALSLLLKEAYAVYHIEEILLCCHSENRICRKLCERVHGILKQEDSYCHYWLSEDEKHIPETVRS